MMDCYTLWELSETVRAEARAAVLETRLRKVLRNEWRSMWQDYIAHPRMLVACAYCNRVRQGGAWVKPPSRVTVLASHTYCPECMKAHWND